MKYQYHTDRPSDNIPSVMGIYPWFKADVDDNGVFEVPDDHEKLPEIKESLAEMGHEPVGESETSPSLTDLSEEDIVLMGYRDLQSLGSDFEDIKGNWGEGKLEEALIKKRREQVDE